MFWVGGLGQEREAAEAALHRLERQEFVQRERRSSVAGETEYAFRHPLVRDVAYGQIPRAQRGEKHRGSPTGSRSSAGPTILPSFSPITTSPFSTTPSRTRSSPAAQLEPWAKRETGRSRSTRTPRLRFLPTRARVGDESKRGTLLLGLGNAFAALADGEAVDRLVDASATLLAAGDPETAAEAETVLAQIAFNTGDAPGVTDHSRRAVELVRGRPRSAAQARALGQAARFAMLGGRWRDAIETGREAERMAAELGLDAVRADALATLGTARDDLGEPGGDADLELAIELAEAANAPLALSRALNNLAWRSTGVDLDRVHELQRRNYETMRRYGHVGQTWWARAQIAGNAYELGRWDEALEHIEAVLAYVAAGTPHYFESGCRLSRAAISFARGDDRTFAEDIDRSLELAAKATILKQLPPSSLSSHASVRGAATFAAHGSCSTRRSRPLDLGSSDSS